MLTVTEAAQTAYFTHEDGKDYLNVKFAASHQKILVSTSTMKRLVAEGAHRIWNEGKDHGPSR